LKSSIPGHPSQQIDVIPLQAFVQWY